MSAIALTTALAGCGGSAASRAQGADDSGTVIEEAGITEDSGSTSHDAGITAADASHALDAAKPTPVEAGEEDADTTYPAFAVDVAQVTDNGGPTLAAPVIVTITWSTDTDAPTYDTFGDQIGPSSYWHTINSEYDVGVATSGTANHISITTAPPASMSDQDLDTFVSSNAGTNWPAPTANTIYAVYMPPGMGLLLGGELDAGGQDACAQDIGGYHTETQNGNYVYAIMPHCKGFQAADVILDASHELNEASTDPHPSTNPAYVGFDDNHLAQEFFNALQDELGDACEFFATEADTTTEPDFAYTVQRQWSNASAAAGHDWCLPAVSPVFYNTTFLPASKMDAINVDFSSFGAGMVASKGFKVALNQSVTFPIGLFSDGPTGGPWNLDVDLQTQLSFPDANGNALNNGTATVTLDKMSGQNGDIVNVTVTPTAFNTLGVVYFSIRSLLPNGPQHHYLPILISQN